MLCVTVTDDGYLSPLMPQPATVTDCTLVIASPGELASNSPWNLSISAAQEIGAWIALAWATAWIFRQVGLVIAQRSESTDE